MTEPEYELWAHETAPKVGWPWWMAFSYALGLHGLPVGRYAPPTRPAGTFFPSYLEDCGWRRVP